MSTTPIDQLASTLRTVEQLVATVGEEQWSQPTPCAGWTVRDLVNHVVLGSQTFTGILRGEQAPSPEEMGRLRSSDQLGDDPLPAYREAADGLLAAFGQPGVLEQTFPLPIGPAPGIAALHLRIVEMLVHGWDLAQATGQPARFSDDIVEPALAFTQRRLADLPPAPPGQGPFGPPQPVLDDAPAVDRLAAVLGRTVPAA